MTARWYQVWAQVRCQRTSFEREDGIGPQAVFQRLKKGDRVLDATWRQCFEAQRLPIVPALLLVFSARRKVGIGTASALVRSKAVDPAVDARCHHCCQSNDGQAEMLERHVSVVGIDYEAS